MALRKVGLPTKSHWAVSKRTEWTSQPCQAIRYHIPYRGRDRKTCKKANKPQRHTVSSQAWFLGKSRDRGVGWKTQPKLHPPASGHFLRPVVFSGRLTWVVGFFKEVTNESELEISHAQGTFTSSE